MYFQWEGLTCLRGDDASSTNDYLAKKLQFHCLKPEEVLLKKGALLDRIFVIISGLLQVDCLPRFSACDTD